MHGPLNVKFASAKQAKGNLHVAGEIK